MLTQALNDDLKHFLKEDDLSDHLYYVNKLPKDLVHCVLKIKSPMVICGLPIFSSVFEHLGAHLPHEIQKKFEQAEGSFLLGEGEHFAEFEVPFAKALMAERLSLNLLGHCSKIASFTQQFVKKASPYNISIIDTRKTTPGLRAFEKYAVRVGGGYNHRFGQTDLWMVKDNHKSYFGGLTEAVDFFRSMHGFYTPILTEIHSLEELDEAIKAEVRHVMLDNFSPELIKQAVDRKPDFMSYEVSGGVTLETLENYLIRGVDAISIGKLT